MSKSKKIGKPPTEYPANPLTSSHKVDEPVADYGVDRSPSAIKGGEANPVVKYAKDEDVRKVADKIFAERKDLFRKLAK